MNKRIFSFIIALIVFFSNAGVVLAIHYCPVMGNTDVSLFNENSCCSDEVNSCSESGQEITFNEKCCDLSVTYHHIDVPSVIPVLVSQDLSLLPDEHFVFGNELFCIEKNSFLLFSKAPPFFSSGKSFLHFAHILLI